MFLVSKEKYGTLSKYAINFCVNTYENKKKWLKTPKKVFWPAFGCTSTWKLVKIRKKLYGELQSICFDIFISQFYEVLSNLIRVIYFEQKYSKNLDFSASYNIMLKPNFSLKRCDEKFSFFGHQPV